MAKESIDRQCDGSPIFRYARANGGDVFWTTGTSAPPSSSGGTAAPYQRLLDVFTREIVHLLALNMLVVYDRTRKQSGSPALTDYSLWHMKNQPTDMGSNRFRWDTDTKRVYFKIIESNPTNPTKEIRAGDTIPRYSYDSDSTPPTSYYIRIGLSYVGSTTNLCTLFEFTTTSQSSMTQAVAANVLPSTYGFSSFRGVSIDLPAPNRTHVLFSGEEDGSTPPTTGIGLRYHVEKMSVLDTHIVTGLRPNQEYLITETNLGGGQFRYTLTESFNVKYYANAAGVLIFDPNGLGSQVGETQFPLDLNDAPPGTSESVDTLSFLEPVINVDINDVRPPKVPGDLPVGSNDDDSSFVVTTSGVTVTPLDINDFNPSEVGSSDTIGLVVPLTLDDDPVSSDDGASTFDVINTYLPPGAYAEKIIRPASPYLWPSLDAGANFCVGVPGDGILWDKIRGGDDGTVIRFGGLNALFVPVSQASFGIDDPSGVARNVRTIRFGLRIGAVNTSIQSPIMVFILRDETGMVRAQYNFPLQVGLEYVYELNSPAVSIDMSAAQLRMASITLQPRSAISVYGNGYYRFDIAEARVEILSYDPPEKVIR